MPVFENSKPLESHVETTPSHDKEQGKKDLVSLADRVRSALAIPEKPSSPEVSENWKSLDRDHAFDPEGFYRIVNQEGYDDFVTSGIVRSRTVEFEGKGLSDLISQRPTAFPSFAKGMPDLTYAKEGEENYIFESAQPMFRSGDVNPVTGFQIRGRHWAYRPIDLVTGEVIVGMGRKDIKNIYKIDKAGNLYIKE